MLCLKWGSFYRLGLELQHINKSVIIDAILVGKAVQQMSRLISDHCDGFIALQSHPTERCKLELTMQKLKSKAQALKECLCPQ